jgi:hypothetical protein
MLSDASELLSKGKLKIIAIQIFFLPSKNNHCLISL